MPLTKSKDYCFWKSKKMLHHHQEWALNSCLCFTNCIIKFQWRMCKDCKSITDIGIYINNRYECLMFTEIKLHAMQSKVCKIKCFIMLTFQTKALGMWICTICTRCFSPVTQRKTSLEKTVSILLCYAAYRNLDSELEANRDRFPLRPLGLEFPSYERALNNSVGARYPKTLSSQKRIWYIISSHTAKESLSF